MLYSHPPSSCPNWFKSILDKQDYLRICHEPVKITKASIVLHTLMNQVESERIANAIKLDGDNKKELKIECMIEAKANIIKSKGEITGEQYVQK